MTVSTDQTLFTYLNATGVFRSNAIPRQLSQLTRLEDRGMDVHHSPSGKKAIIGMDCQGNEKQQLYVLDMENLQTEGCAVLPEDHEKLAGRNL